MIRRVIKAGLPAMVVGLACFGVASPSAAQDRPANAGADEARFLLLQSKPKAYAVVESTAGHDSARIRMAGLEAAQHAPDAALDLARAGIVDENPAVRFAALVTIGKLELGRLADAALDLTRDDNPSVRAAAIFAAKRCGRDVDLSPLGAMLASPSPTTRANAAMLIGQLGDAQAFDMLRDMAGRPMPRVSTAERAWVRLQFAEAMIRLNPDDLEVLSTIRAAMFSTHDDVRVLAMQVLGDIGDRAVVDGLAAVIKRDNPVQAKIAAAQAMAQLGDRRGVKTLIDASSYDRETLAKELQAYLRKADDDNSAEARALQEVLADPAQLDRIAAEVRAQAARGLTWVRTAASAQRLAELLDDPDTIVRVASAAAVLRASR
ncbi:MAG: HEAT repeat domain-containing protein [Phycisphaeraceae bacterium]